MEEDPAAPYYTMSITLPTTTDAEGYFVPTHEYKVKDIDVSCGAWFELILEDLGEPKSVDTGDNTPIMLLGAMLLLSACGLVVIKKKFA